MFCKECGNEINDKAIICPKCGCATDNPTPNDTKSFNNVPSKKHKGFVFTATGRASRSAFWTQQLIMIGIGVILLILLGIGLVAAEELDPYGTGDEGAYIFVGLLSIIFAIFAIVAGIYNIMLTIRRIHDFGKSGFFVLLTLIPYIGGIIWLVFGCLDSEKNANEYGTEPDVIA